MSKPPKIDRKTLRSPDEFVKKGSVVLEIIAVHRQKFLWIIVAGLLGTIGWYVSDWWQGRGLEKGWTRFVEADKATGDQRWEKLKALFNEGKKNRPSLFAGVAVADHYFDEGKKESLAANANGQSAAMAAEWYTKVLDFKDLLPVERQLLLINRGNANELQKKWDQALADYKAAADLGGEAKGLAMLSSGRVFELKKDNAKAAETYEKVSIDFLNTEYARSAKNNLRRLKSPLFANQKP